MSCRGSKNERGAHNEEAGGEISAEAEAQQTQEAAPYLALRQEKPYVGTGIYVWDSQQVMVRNTWYHSRYWQFGY